MNQNNSIDILMNRVKKMEQYLDEIIYLLEQNPFSMKTNPDIQKKINILKDYYDNGNWIADYEADERGELPDDLKRGVLAQDTLYNLFDSLNHIEEMGIVMDGIILELDINNLKMTVNSIDNDSIIQFNLCEDIGIYDQNENKLSIQTLKEGMQVQIRHAEFMTMSIPPQTTAYEIIIL